MNPPTSPDPDKQQQELQKMLALKRHEAPPPRFFRSFSDQVIDRLHAQEPPAPATLRQRLGLDIDSKPVLVCASGVAVCGLLVVGLIASLRLGPPQRPPRAPEATFLILTPPPTAAASPEQDAGPAGGSAPLPQLGQPVPEPSLTPLSSPRAQPTAVPVSVQGKTPPPQQQ